MKKILLLLTVVLLASCYSAESKDAESKSGEKMPQEHQMQEDHEMTEDHDSAHTEDHAMEMKKAGITMLNMSLTEWAVSLEKSEIPAGKTMFHIMNNGVATHDIHIMNNDFSSEQVSVEPGEMKMLTLDLKPGVYDIHCPIPGHTEKGMHSALTVK